MSRKSLVEQYTEALPTSRKLYERAQGIFPSGVTHDSRYLKPFPLYVVRAKGSRKWDVDGREYIDYWMGHGSLLLGHNHPEVEAAVHEQLSRGTHYGACHEKELEWGELVTQLIPSAERVKFTSSGTEATLMAIRLARSYTGKTKIVKFEGHFHGWHDHVVEGVMPPYEVPVSPGLLSEVVGSTLLCPPNDGQTLRQILRNNPDVACVLIEPTGASFGAIPTKGEFLQELRQITREHNVILIFDEVITGFRCSPGGAQGYYNVIPDLTTLAKILAGGLPGGAVVGKKDILELLEFKEDREWNRYKKIAHPGTYNANPLSAAAGVAALRIIASGEENKKADKIAQHLRSELNSVIDKHQVPWKVYGDFSGLHFLFTYEEDQKVPFDPENFQYDYRKLKGGNPQLFHAFRCAMLLHGVDVTTTTLTSSAHTLEDVDKTATAFDRTIALLKEDGLID